MKRHPYSANGVKLSFWLQEFTRTVTMLEDDVSWEEIRRLALEENLYATSSTERAKRIYLTMRDRMKDMDPSFIGLYLESDQTTQKLIVLTGILESDTLLFDFVHDIIRDKLIIGDLELRDSDIRIFFAGKQRDDARAAGWYDETLHRLGAYYKTMLLEAGVLKKEGTKWTIQPPLPEHALEIWWNEHGYEPVYRALLGVS